MAVDFELVELFLQLGHGVFEPRGFQLRFFSLPRSVNQFVRKLRHRYLPLLLPRRRRVVHRRRRRFRTLPSKRRQNRPENAVGARRRRRQGRPVFERSDRDLFASMRSALVAGHRPVGCFLGFSRLRRLRPFSAVASAVFVIGRRRLWSGSSTGRSSVR